MMKVWLVLLCFFSSTVTGEVYHSDSDMVRCYAEVCDEKNCNLNQNTNHNNFSIINNRLISSEYLENLAATYLTDNSLIKAEIVRRKISDLYACLGYINSGAILQIEPNNHFNYKISEGVVSKKTLIIQGNMSEADQDYIRAILLSGKNKKNLNINNVRKQLRKLKNIGRYKNIKVDVSPKSLEEAFLRVKTNRKESALSGQLYINNGQSDFVGKERLGFEVKYGGFNDPTQAVYFSGSLSEGLKNINASYRFSDYHGDYLDISLSHAESLIIQSPLNVLDIKNTSNKLAATAYIDLWENSEAGEYAAESNRNSRLSSLFTFELLESRNSLLGRNFSFSENEIDGKAKIALMKAQLDWSSESRNSAYSVSNYFEVGKHLMNVSNFAQYNLLRGNVGYKSIINEKTNFTLRGTYQLSKQNLPSAKKIGLGGSSSLRGARNNAIFSDSALFASAQLDTKLGVFSPWAISGLNDGQLYLSAFIDYGFGENNNETNTKSLTTAGLGLDWRLNKEFSVNLHWGTVVDKDFSVRNNDSFYFNLVKRFGE